MKSRLLSICVISALSILILLVQSHSEEIARPPSDDSLKSTVRLNTEWIDHSLDRDGCLSLARTTLTKLGYFVELTKSSAFGLLEGRTVLIRCDHEGVAFFAAAYRTRPNLAMQEKILNEIKSHFERKE